MDPAYLIVYVPLKSATNLYTNTLGLRFRLKRAHFKQGNVSIKCTATIAGSYFETSGLEFPGLGLGEKALESRGGANGEGKVSHLPEQNYRRFTPKCFSKMFLLQLNFYLSMSHLCGFDCISRTVLFAVLSSKKTKLVHPFSFSTLGKSLEG